MARNQPIYSLNKEFVQKIQPDLILAQDLCRVCAVPSGQVQDALEELECSAQVISLDPKSIEEVISCIATVGSATGTEERAKALADELLERVEEIRRHAARLPSIATLCLEWSDPPFVGGHWIPGMVQIAGGANLLGEAEKPSRRVTWRGVAESNAEVIVFMPCGYYLEDAEV